jgi:hypothetical protein
MRRGQFSLFRRRGAFTRLHSIIVPGNRGREKIASRRPAYRTLFFRIPRTTAAGMTAIRQTFGPKAPPSPAATGQTAI